MWWCCALLFAAAALRQNAVLAQQPEIACIVAVDKASTGEAWRALRELPGLGVAVGADKGLFLASDTSGKMTITPAGDTDIGAVLAMPYSSEAEWLIDASKGSYLARVAADKISVLPTELGKIHERINLPGKRLLIVAENGLFVASILDGKIKFARVDVPSVIGQVSSLMEVVGQIDVRSSDPNSNFDFSVREVDGKFIFERLEPPPYIGRSIHDFSLPSGDLLFQTPNGVFFNYRSDGKVWLKRAAIGSISSTSEVPGLGVTFETDEGLFLAHETNGNVVFTLLQGAGKVSAHQLMPSVGVLVGTENGLFLLRADKTIIERAVDVDVGQVTGMSKLGGDVLVAAEKGIFLVREKDNKVSLVSMINVDAGRVDYISELPGDRLLIYAQNGFFLADEVDGNVSIARTGEALFTRLEYAYEFPTGEILMIGGDKDFGPNSYLFVAQNKNGRVSISPLDHAEFDNVLDMVGTRGGAALIRTPDGLFLARVHSGKITFVRVPSKPNVDQLEEIFGLPHGGFLIRTKDVEYYAVPTSLALIQVNIRDKTSWDGKQIDARPTPSSLVFKLEHECAPSFDELGLKVRLAKPGEEPPGALTGIERTTLSPSNAELLISPLFDRPGQWSFQVVATAGGVERPIGSLQTLNFVGGPLWERWWKGLTVAFGLTIALINVLLFGFSRRSAWAWRLATDDGWGTWMLRVATLALSHVRWAQLWILDLYFQRFRKRLQRPRPFLPLPLAAGDGKVASTTDALALPWKGKHLWVQGASGMGKTAIFRHFTEAHFREYETAFSAHAEWGCIVVPFAARDFASSGEDKDDPAWVVDAVRATLSSEGLTFASTTLLFRFLESGIIGVAVDGLNEVDRTRAVTAFSRTFSEAPMLITSQEVGSDRFVTWRLPSDIRDFTDELVKLYLPAEDAEVVIKRVAASGLQDAIRSGYDVRLVIDLARTDPHHAVLPADRMGLYAAVVEAGWPNVSEDKRREQQSLTAAAAWRMVSERKPNEDMRRLKPDVDLPANLLEALADALGNDGRPLRLVRRVGAGAYEFVHDQMHAYLAARWFAKDGIQTSELQTMVEGSTIWMQTPDARRTLWGFAAALLDDVRLVDLWERVEDKEERDILRRALKAEAERRGLAVTQVRPTKKKRAVKEAAGQSRPK
jgi:hypothetical protein